ncbi:MAG: hypothetical protein U0524_01765 [Candidatus Saccharimonadales bacterium]
MMVLRSTNGTYCEPGNVGGVKTEPVLYHFRIHKDKSGQNKTKPELILKHLNRMTSVFVVFLVLTVLVWCECSIVF